MLGCLLESIKDISIEFHGLVIQPLGMEDICIEFSSDTAEVAGYQSSRLDRENQPDSPSMGGIMVRGDDDADFKSVTYIVNIQRWQCLRVLFVVHVVTFQVVGHIFTPAMKVGKIGLIVGV